MIACIADMAVELCNTSSTFTRTRSMILSLLLGFEALSAGELSTAKALTYDVIDNESADMLDNRFTSVVCYATRPVFPS
jgi:hypothetical protein